MLNEGVGVGRYMGYTQNLCTPLDRKLCIVVFQVFLENTDTGKYERDLRPVCSDVIYSQRVNQGSDSDPV